MYRILYDKQTVKDIKNLKAARLDKKAKQLIEIIPQDPFQNPPPFEGLLGSLSGYFSRRINIQHRLVYQVFEKKVTVDDIEYDGTIKIIRMWSHYDALR